MEKVGVANRVLIQLEGCLLELVLLTLKGVVSHVGGVTHPLRIQNLQNTR